MASSAFRVLLWCACAEGLLFSRPASGRKRVAVVGGGFAGLTAARKLSSRRDLEVLLLDQRSYFEYTPGILRAWVEPKTHRLLVNPLSNLLRSKRASFQRVLPDYTARILENTRYRAGETRYNERPLTLSVTNGQDESVLSYPCDYVVLATGGELGPVSDDRQTADGSIAARRRRLEEQVGTLMGNASSVLVVGGGLTGVEFAAECAERFPEPGAVTLAVGPTLPSRGAFEGDAGSGVLPGFADTRTAVGRLGESGAVAYVRRHLERRGVRVCEQWAVPPPASGAPTNAYRPGASAGRYWRDGGGGKVAESWEAAGPERDLVADAVFDCRGLRPNNARSYGVRQSLGFRPNLPVDGVRDEGATAGGVGGLPSDVVDVSGWLIVDERFRLSRVRTAAREAALEATRTVFEPAYGGRVYCCGDACCKDKQERTAANAHAEGEYVALDIVADARGGRPFAPYVKPPRLTAVSLGKWDGVVVLAGWVALRGWLAALAKQAIQFWFVHFLPLPYWLLRRLPGRKPRKSYDFVPRVEVA